jgi:tRNA A-37 threonylcarbamoyl transferase component Bud32
VVYLKRYGVERWGDRLRRWWVDGPGASPAAVEARNIRAAEAAGIGTMEALSFGHEFADLAGVVPLGAARSYIVVTEVPGEALSRCGAAFLARCAEKEATDLTGELVELARRLHGAGYVHRDLYSSHIFLHERGGEVGLYLIDLARMFRPRWRKARWRVKDLAQLKFSMPGVWVDGWWDSFGDGYFAGMPARRRARWERAIDRKVSAMERQQRRRARRGERRET